MRFIVWDRPVSTDLTEFEKEQAVFAKMKDDLRRTRKPSFLRSALQRVVALVL